MRARLREALRGGRYFWWWLTVSIIIVGICLKYPDDWLPRPGTLSDRTRWAGMLFQIAGICCVILGLNGSRVFLGDTGILVSSARWLISWLHIFDKPKIVSASVTIELPSLTLSAQAGSAQVNPTTETRLSALETDFATLRSETKKGFSDVRFHALKLLNKEREERSAALVAASDTLRTVVSGGAALQVTGALYLIIGVVFTSIPDEFSQFVHPILR